ncbi:hypothetical protein [Acidiphilium angustum]|uniref:Uncharacterized protein n=1 Tax=Acidiphilium rubrum TaxID=526 RepID=A0A8G2CNW3_ACIRU|nr:hypothetical protein [Acidiphilium angustum]SIR51192.1 hypothetical protein SAMN05421828_14315 [Acidiphilium rubrum]
MKSKSISSLDMRRLAAVILFLTGGVLLAVILAKPEITLLPAPAVTQPSGKVVR